MNFSFISFITYKICSYLSFKNFSFTIFTDLFADAIKEGKKPIALLAPIVTVTEYEKENGQGNDFLCDSVSYDVLPVYDISQVDVTENTPDFGRKKLSENRIEEVLKEQWQVMVIEDITE